MIDCAIGRGSVGEGGWRPLGGDAHAGTETPPDDVNENQKQHTSVHCRTRAVPSTLGMDSDDSGSPPSRTAAAGDAAAADAADAAAAPPAAAVASRKRRRAAEPTELRAEKLKEFEDIERQKGVVRTCGWDAESVTRDVACSTGATGMTAHPPSTSIRRPLFAQTNARACTRRCTCRASRRS
jgi:hypothetical protein